MTTTAWPLRAGARRMPLLAVDGVETVPNGFVGRKRVTADDPYLAGHFPTLAVYPGVFLIESLQQMLELHLDGVLGGVELVGIESARFSRPALAGDEVLFETTITGERTRLTTDTTCVDADRRRYARITATWTCRS
jgi:3-hydroxyacyl-[acyl-carrier-protein] dehydratase